VAATAPPPEAAGEWEPQCSASCRSPSTYTNASAPVYVTATWLHRPAGTYPPRTSRSASHGAHPHPTATEKCTAPSATASATSGEEITVCTPEVLPGFTHASSVAAPGTESSAWSSPPERSSACWRAAASAATSQAPSARSHDAACATSPRSCASSPSTGSAAAYAEAAGPSAGWPFTYVAPPATTHTCFHAPATPSGRPSENPR